MINFIKMTYSRLSIGKRSSGNIAFVPRFEILPYVLPSITVVILVLMEQLVQSRRNLMMFQ